jgi:signal transduction histidine kinase
LAAHLQSAREAERSHLAREIHDELGQSLTGLKLEVSYIGRRAADDEPTRERLRGVVQMIDACIASVRRIAADLRPQMLDELGMIEAIRWQVNEFERRTGVPCALEFPDRRIGWQKEKDTAMFRILQEALTNIARHAEATHAWVKVELEEDCVLLQIGDDGRGFSRDSIVDGSSFGLIGMEERARICGGSIEFAPAGESGTIVSVRFPWQPPSDDQSEP